MAGLSIRPKPEGDLGPTPLSTEKKQKSINVTAASREEGYPRGHWCQAQEDPSQREVLSPHLICSSERS